MRQQTFVARRKGTWERLETLVAAAARRGVRRLGAPEIAELGRTYRATTSDLAFARGSEYEPQIVEYLNRLVARSHGYVTDRLPRAAAHVYATSSRATFR